MINYCDNDANSSLILCFTKRGIIQLIQIHRRTSISLSLPCLSSPLAASLSDSSFTPASRPFSHSNSHPYSSPLILPCLSHSHNHSLFTSQPHFLSVTRPIVPSPFTQIYFACIPLIHSHASFLQCPSSFTMHIRGLCVHQSLMLLRLCLIVCTSVYSIKRKQ